MTRVKRGTIKNKRRKNILSQTKGYRHARKSKLRQARQAIFKAGTHAFRDRRNKKRVARRGWSVTLNAALRPLGLSYSKFINLLTQKKVSLNRKVLAEIATDNPESFERIVKNLS